MTFAVGGNNVHVLPQRMSCMACGARATAPCNCGAPYVTPGERALAAIEEHPTLSNLAIAKRIGVDEITVRRARKKSRSAFADRDVIIDTLGRMQPARQKHKRKPAVKLFKARKVKGYKPPTNEKEQLLAFNKALSEFCMHFGIELREWLDTEPTMEAAGRDSLAFTLSAFATELQYLAQRVDQGGKR